MNAILLIAKAGISYFGVVFAFGFLFGAIRVLILSPLFDETVAVLIELPIMLAISWIVCTRTMNYFSVPEHFFKRLAIGVLAFACLMGAEAFLAVGLFDQNLKQFVSETRTLRGSLGLIGQGLFAVFPILQVNVSQLRQQAPSS